MRAKDFIKEDYDTSQDADAGYDYEGGGNVDWDEHDDSPNDADGFIVDKPSGGYDASVDQKFLGNFEDSDLAFQAIRDNAGPNYFPSVWFVDDHGGMQPFTPYDQELMAGDMKQWDKEANELMASRGQLPKAQARIRRHKLR